MRKLVPLFAVMFVALASFGCKKSVDPEYLDKQVKWAEAVCACAKLPHAEAAVCSRKVPWDDKTPTGEPSGIYENSLSADDLAKVNAARELGEKCGKMISAAAPAN